MVRVAGEYTSVRDCSWVTTNFLNADGSISGCGICARNLSE